MSLRTRLIEEDYILEEDVPESQSQIDLSDYLRSVLKQVYALEKWFVTGNLAIFPPDNSYPFRYLAPDIALFKGVVVSAEEKRTLSSWRMAEPNRPAPTLVIEISSKETWPQDLDPKLQHYGLLGVREYIAYDPGNFWQLEINLKGWRYENGLPQEIEPNEYGWLWSNELESWFIAEGSYLRICDKDGNPRPTVEEAALEQAEADRRTLQELLEKLRQNNIDPDLL